MSGIYFTTHALERCRERGIDPDYCAHLLPDARSGGRRQVSDFRFPQAADRLQRQRREHRHRLQGQTAQASAQKTQTGF